MYILTLQVLSMFFYYFVLTFFVLSRFSHFWGHIPGYFWTRTDTIHSNLQVPVGTLCIGVLATLHHVPRWVWSGLSATQPCFPMFCSFLDMWMSHIEYLNVFPYMLHNSSTDHCSSKIMWCPIVALTTVLCIKYNS